MYTQWILSLEWKTAGVVENETPYYDPHRWCFTDTIVLKGNTAVLCRFINPFPLHGFKTCCKKLKRETTTQCCVELINTGAQPIVLCKSMPVSDILVHPAIKHSLVCVENQFFDRVHAHGFVCPPPFYIPPHLA